MFEIYCLSGESNRFLFLFSPKSPGFDTFFFVPLPFKDPDAVLDPNEKVNFDRDSAEKRAKGAFQSVFEHGPKIQWDHHLVYHARTCVCCLGVVPYSGELYLTGVLCEKDYELGRLLVCSGDVEAGRVQFELVFSGKLLEVSPNGRKGKYSMEVSSLQRTLLANPI